MVFRSFVAIGDSFTEGLEDLRPDGTYRGWADLVAEHLDATTPGLRYANLAVRGRRMPRIILDQVPQALALQADLITFAAGGNDILRLRCDLDRLVSAYDATLARLTASGTTVLAFAGFDPRRRIPLTQIPGDRAERYNDGIRQSADRHGALLVDLWDLPHLYEAAMWAPDRLHLSSAGHALVAAEVLRVLGRSIDADLVSRGSADETSPRWTAARAQDAQWVVRHFTPWVAKGITATRASQDALQPKRPDLAPVIHRENGPSGHRLPEPSKDLPPAALRMFDG